MSADYQGIETAKLIAMFVEGAKDIPTIFPELPEAYFSGLSAKVRPSPERSAKIDKLTTIAAALLARKPIAEARRLMDDDNLDVRGWATGMLRPLDPEWSAASQSGLFARLKTREVLAQRAFALQKPPFGPPIDTLSDDELVARFQDLGEREEATQFLDCVGNPKDMDIRNEIVGQTLDAMRALKARGLLPRLLPLFDIDKVAVRYEAALACMRIAPEKSIAVLEAIVASRNPEYSALAQDALNHWRKNNSVVYGM